MYAYEQPVIFKGVSHAEDCLSPMALSHSLFSPESLNLYGGCL